MKVKKQHDSMQCGITCLQMICRYFGREYSLDSLSKICFATTEGVSMLGINEAAKILGFQTFSARATIEELSETPLPCILHWNQNHFVVLYKVKKAGVVSKNMAMPLSSLLERVLIQCRLNSSRL